MRSRLCRTSLVSCLCTATLLVSGLAYVPQAHASGAAHAEPKASVLDIEGDDRAAAFTKALRAELEKRGMHSGRGMSMAELKLTMGCEDGDTACIAEGGATLEVDELVYGQMTPKGENFQVELQLLDVKDRTVITSIQARVAVAEFADDKVAATASRLSIQLLGPPPEDQPAPAPAPAAAPSEEPGDETEEPAEESGEEEGSMEPEEEEKSGGLVWGPYNPRPTWKKAGLGLSAGLAVAGIGAAVGAGWAISGNGPVRTELLDSAEASLSDSSSTNDVDPNASGDLCVTAREELAPGQVRNGTVSQVCNKADALAATATAGAIAAGVFGLSTVIFTVAFFAHKEDGDSQAQSGWRARQAHLGVAPLGLGSNARGLMASGGLRF